MASEKSEQTVLAAPPAQDEYPVKALVVVIDDLGRACAAAEAARSVSASVPYVIRSDEVESLDARRQKQQGVPTRLYHALAGMVSDEQGLERRYIAEAQLGHHMVVASAEDDAQADRVWRVLRAYGAHHGTWSDTWSVRELL